MGKKDNSQLIKDSKKNFTESIDYGFYLLSQHENTTGAIINLEKARESYHALQSYCKERLGPEYIHKLESLEEKIKTLNNKSLSLF